MVEISMFFFQAQPKKMVRQRRTDYYLHPVELDEIGKK